MITILDRPQVTGDMALLVGPVSLSLSSGFEANLIAHLGRDFRGKTPTVSMRRLVITPHNGLCFVAPAVTFQLRNGHDASGNLHLDFERSALIPWVPRDDNCALIFELIFTIQLGTDSRDVTVGFTSYRYFEAHKAGFVRERVTGALARGPGISPSSALVFSGVDFATNEPPREGINLVFELESVPFVPPAPPVADPAPGAEMLPSSSALPGQQQQQQQHNQQQHAMQQYSSQNHQDPVSQHQHQQQHQHHEQQQQRRESISGNHQRGEPSGSGAAFASQPLASQGKQILTFREEIDAQQVQYIAQQQQQQQQQQQLQQQHPGFQPHFHPAMPPQHPSDPYFAQGGANAVRAPPAARAQFLDHAQSVLGYGYDILI